MGWFDFSRRSPSGGSVETLHVPLFPLNTVLFPGSVLPLKIFEQRYLDMAAACMKDNTPFGICLIASGSEVGGSAEPHAGRHAGQHRRLGNGTARHPDDHRATAAGASASSKATPVPAACCEAHSRTDRRNRPHPAAART